MDTLGVLLGRGCNGVVAGLKPGQQLQDVVNGRLEGGTVLKNLEDVPLVLQHPVVVLVLRERERVS